MDSRLLATIIIFPIWLGLLILLRRRQHWTLAYIFGAFGLTLELVFLAEYLGLDQLLVNIASFHVDLLVQKLFHFKIELLTMGRLQLFYPDGGSSILKLGIECSAVLESAILVSLIAFYPLFSREQKLLRITFGLVMTYIINLARLMIIVLMTYKLGPDYIFIAHALAARVFFFFCEIFLYWWLLSKPTVRIVGESIKRHIPLKKAAEIGISLNVKYAATQIIIIASDDWQKVLIVAKKERPLIYKEETGFYTKEDQKILGVQESLVKSLPYKNLQPNGEKKQQFSINYYAPLDIRLAEGKSTLEVEIYLNGQLENRSIVGQKNHLIIDRKIFAEPIYVTPDDVLEIKVKNLGQEEASFLLEVYLSKGVFDG